jgi:hypothetical protein
MSKAPTPFHGLEPDTALFQVQSGDFKVTYNWSTENGEANDITMSISGTGHSPEAIIKLLGTHHTATDYSIHIMPDTSAEMVWQNRKEQDAQFRDRRQGKMKPHEETVLEFQREIQAIHARFTTDFPTTYLDMVLKDEDRELAGAMLYVLVTRQVWGLIISQLEKGKNPQISFTTRWEATLTNKKLVLPGERLTFGMNRVAATNIPMCGRVVSMQVQI